MNTKSLLLAGLLSVVPAFVGACDCGCDPVTTKEVVVEQTAEELVKKSVVTEEVKEVTVEEAVAEATPANN